MQQNLILYGDIISHPTRSVMAVLSKFKVPYTFKKIVIFKGQTRSQQFRSVSPTGKIPVLVVKSPSHTIFESQAIVKYIILRYCKKESDHFYPIIGPMDQDDKRVYRAVRMQQFLSWHHLNLRQSAMIFLGLFAPLRDKEGAQRKGRRFLQRSLKFMNDYWLKDQSYLAGGKTYSFADTQAICELMQFVSTEQYWREINNKDKYPRVVKWLNKMLQKQEIKDVFEKLQKNDLLPKL